MPSDDAVAPGPHLARAASSRAEYHDRATSPPRRRFRMRRQRRKARDEQGKAAVVGRSRITVVDRQLPRQVLTGREAGFDRDEWAEYRGKINQLAEDEGFMQYLTAPVKEKGALEEDRDREADPQQLAMNKLYPLAFIRLLEAHARYANQSEVVDPEEEAHRYDDLDGEDEDRVLRTASSGLHDMGRFRTVGSVRGGYRGTGTKRLPPGQRVGLIEDRPVRSPEGRSGPFSNFRRNMSRENRTASVSVY